MANIWKFSLFATDTTNNVEFVQSVHYQTDVPLAGSEPAAADVLDYILAHFSSSAHNVSKWAACSPTTTTFDRAAVVQRVTPDSGDLAATADELIGFSGYNAVGDNKLSPEHCGWIHTDSGLASRSGRGGVHGGPILNSAYLEGGGDIAPGSAYGIGMIALAASIEDVIDNVFSTTGDLKPVIYSLTRHKRGLDPTSDIETAVFRKKIRFLRSRSRT